jgi:membrane protein insertase Oxa1/YidC/SpoIIIJ
MLYAALVSPQFIELAGKTSGEASFLFIKSLNSPIRNHMGTLGDKAFGYEKGDTFSSGNYVTVYTAKGVIKDVKVNNPKGIFFNKENKLNIKPGEPVNLKVNTDALDLSSSELGSATKAVIPVVNDNTKEIEDITFNKTGSVFDAQIKTERVKDTINYDVLMLIILFGVTMFASQKFMTSMSNTASMDPSQKAMQEQMSKIMPIMITGTFIFFPIPAGVLLYMIVSNIIQVIQSVTVNKQMEMEEAAKPKTVVNKVPSDAVKIEGKEKDKDEVLVEQPSAITDKKKKDKKGKW